MLNIGILCIFSILLLAILNKLFNFVSGIETITNRNQITTKNNIMKTALLTSILALVISGLTISGLLRYNGILRYNLAEIAIQNTDGADIDITETLHAYGFDLDVFDEPTTFDYIKSNFK